MKYPISTGQADLLLGVTEPRLNSLIRKRRIDPEPAVSAGRRLWEMANVIRAAEHLGILTGELRLQLESGDRAALEAHHG
jgi:hypothetical protein